MWSQAQTAEEVFVSLDEAEFIGDVNDLSTLSESYSEYVKAKIMPSGIVLENGLSFQIKELGLNTKGPQEDELYALNSFLVKNIRRGNTIIEVLEPKSQDSEQSIVQRYIGRKGLNKFFDISMDFIQQGKRNHDNGLSAKEFNIKNQIMGGVLKALKGGACVEVIKTLKANGENA